MYEVRFHGRGGQGVVMAAQTLAEAGVYEGNFAIAFPFFGAERRGAPVLAFTRVDKKKIRIRSQIYEPDYVVVLDESLLDTINVVDGLKPNGMVIINSQKKPEEINFCTSSFCRIIKVATVDATSIAIENGAGTKSAPAVNTAILGAFAFASKEVKIESIEKAILSRFGERLGEKIAKANVNASNAAYKKTVIGSSNVETIRTIKKQWLPTWQELPIGGVLKSTQVKEGFIGPASFIENKTGGWRTFTPKYDIEKCTGCLLCWFYCPEGCIKKFTNENGKVKMKFDYDYCKGCGICANECPVDAIVMER